MPKSRSLLRPMQEDTKLGAELAGVDPAAAEGPRDAESQMIETRASPDVPSLSDAAEQMMLKWSRRRPKKLGASASLTLGSEVEDNGLAGSTIGVRKRGQPRKYDKPPTPPANQGVGGEGSTRKHGRPRKHPTEDSNGSADGITPVTKKRDRSMKSTSGPSATVQVSDGDGDLPALRDGTMTVGNTCDSYSTLSTRAFCRNRPASSASGSSADARQLASGDVAGPADESAAYGGASDTSSSISVGKDEVASYLDVPVTAAADARDGPLRCHECRQCGKVYIALAALTEHSRIHVRRKSECPTCGKTFSRKYLLNVHLRVHSGEKPYKCSFPDCAKSFADRSNLRTHVLTHTVTTRSHVCRKCKKAFAQKRYLNKHMHEVCFKECTR